MSYLDALKQNTNQARTANGAVSNKSTLDPVLDFFSKAGAMRHDVDEACRLFKRAYAADPLKAVRCLFYIRDVRGGQGEREVFRACFDVLSQEHQDRLYEFVPEYGRWDDLPVNVVTATIIEEQILEDERNKDAGKSVSLLAKWLPSENTSSPETIKKARALISLLGWTPTEYRKRVVALRKYIKLLEQQMSSKEWDEVDYEKIPSQAHRKHVKAFRRNDGTRYENYLESVQKGEKAIKTQTLFTYEVFETVGRDEDAANAMWANLPDYTNGDNAIVLADVSGSMSGRPMAISVSLALYFAERNSGPFKNCFMTFSAHPRVVEVLGNTLAEKLDNIESREWGYNTDVAAALRSILNAAIASKCPQEEMPKVLYIISDMQFDEAANPNETNFNDAKRAFEAAGYEMPHVVFWNCNAWGDDAPATMFDNNVTLISGSNQSTFQYALAGKTPLESMNDILESERYAQITLEPVEKSLEDIPF